jgi:hypothetical protein
MALTRRTGMLRTIIKREILEYLKSAKFLIGPAQSKRKFIRNILEVYFVSNGG